jgi:excisionase family DNA binding protein
MKPLLTSKAVCALLGITPATLSRMVHSKRIPHVILTAGRRKLVVRFKEDDLEAWINRRSRGPAPKGNGKDNDRQDPATPSTDHHVQRSRGLI